MRRSSSVPTKKPIRLEDFPQFTIEGVDASGTAFIGRFNSLEHVREGRCYLMLSNELALPGEMTGIQTQDLSANF
jgi:hypothetical protein